MRCCSTMHKFAKLSILHCRRWRAELSFELSNVFVSNAIRCRCRCRCLHCRLCSPHTRSKSLVFGGEPGVNYTFTQTHAHTSSLTTTHTHTLIHTHEPAYMSCICLNFTMLHRIAHTETTETETGALRKSFNAIIHLHLLAAAAAR